MLIEPAVQTPLDRLDVEILKNEPSIYEEKEVKSTNNQENNEAEHDLEAGAPDSTGESPMTINACDPSQDQVMMNVPQEMIEETTSPLEGETSHLPALRKTIPTLREEKLLIYPSGTSE